MCPTWEDGLATAVKDRTFVYVGIGLAHLAGFVAAGATVRAAVDVTLAGARPGDAGVPVLSLETATRSAPELQVPAFADILDARADDVCRFFDRHDPRSEAIVLSALAVPSAAIGGRTCWTTDAPWREPSRPKPRSARDSMGSSLGFRVEPAPEQCRRSLVGRHARPLGCDRLVAQSIGLHAGGVRTWICDSVQEV